MKTRLLFLLMAVTLICSCSNDVPKLVKSENTYHSIKTKEEAIKIAFDHISQINPSRADEYIVSEVSIFYGNSSRSNNDTLIYAINFSNEMGFVLVSAARIGEEIIGYNNESNLCMEKDENSSFNFYIDLAKEYVADQISATNNSQLVSPQLEIIPNPSIPVTTKTEIIEPRITVEWGQEYPTGSDCPNHKCGCVITAIAQIMSYFKRPSSITLTCPDYESQIYNLNWEEINKHIRFKETSPRRHLFSCEASEDIHKSISILCRELGHRAWADYSDPTRTRVSEYLGLEVLEELMPASINIDGFIGTFPSGEDIYDYLDSHDAVAYVSGTDMDTNRAHAWTLCGAQRLTKISHNVGIGGEDHYFKTYYVFFNWGWNGANNGYFTPGVFDPSKYLTSKSRANYSKNVDMYWVYK